jgi:hypothetical protein
MKYEDGRARASSVLVVGMALTMTGFALAAVGTSVFVERRHPGGLELYAIAALLSIPIACMLAVFGMYLERERDEFQRVMVVRSLLWAIGGTLVMGVFTGYVRMYGGVLKLPGFSELVAFWLMFGLAQGIQGRRHRVGRDD